MSSSGSRNMHGGESSLLLTSSASSTSSHDQPRVLLDARALRSQGGIAFVAQDWKHAIQLYTDAVKILLESWDTSALSASSSSSSSSSFEVTKELVLGFSNRAEARLRLKHFEAAQVDASKALRLQKNHVKSLFRKGRALHGLHQYKEAILCFTEGLQIANDEKGMSVKELTSALEASKICAKQARTGNYDLLKMWREVEKGREPVCGEYLGPVEIGPARDRALGRGLLVTRDVEPGDLLIVSKAVAHSKLGCSSLAGLSKSEINDACTGKISLSLLCNVYYEDLSSQLLDRAGSSKRFLEQVCSLSRRDGNGMENNILPMDLFAGGKPTPTGLDDVLNVEDEALDAARIDMERVCKVTRRKAFPFAGELDAALWLLPSLINHSCVPNACWARVGKEALFVRAAHHLMKGQEVTISYLLNPVIPLSTRTSFLEHYRGFECRCERCKFERAMEPFIKQIELKVLLQPMDIMVAVEVVESLEWAFRNVRAFGDEEKKKQWVRTSYAPCYARLLSLYDDASSKLQQRVKDMEPLEASLRAVRETMGGSEEFLTMVRQRVVHWWEDCRPQLVRGLVGSMYVCLYGKQRPADLRALVALRYPMLASAQEHLLCCTVP